MNNYEILAIFDTNGKPDSAESILKAFTANLEENGGKIADVEDMGHKVFTREAKLHKQSGHYVKIWCSLGAEFADRIHDHFRLDETVFRLILTKDPGSFRPTDVPEPAPAEEAQPADTAQDPVGA